MKIEKKNCQNNITKIDREKTGKENDEKQRKIKGQKMAEKQKKQ